MSRIKLDSRLKSVASLVPKNKVVADIGTDHAYLLCYLIENGICPCGIASDINKGPLDNARQTVIDCGLSDKVKLILSDGLQNVPENSVDVLVLAGMGGILISEILEKAPWVCNENIHIVAQPMTHAEIFRKFLCDNGFTINQEKISTDGKRLYVAVLASFNGKVTKRDKSYYYLGELLKNDDDITKEYVNKLILTLEKKYSAQSKAGIEDKDNLKELIDEIKTKVRMVYG